MTPIVAKLMPRMETALVHDLVVVTRNEKHIAPAGVRCFNPFEPGPS